MRQIGTLPKGLDPKVFTDYLLGLGMKSRVDEQPGGWDLWIYNEDQVPKARDELRDFLSRPEDPRFREVARAAETVRRQEQQLDRQFRKNYREVTDLWAAPGIRRRPVTSILVAVCVAVFLLQNSSWGARDRRQATSGDRLVRLLQFSGTHIGPDGRLRGNGFDDILHGEAWRLVSPIFLHFGILHIFFNVGALSAFGTIIEMRRGSLRLAILVLVSAIASNIGQHLYMEQIEPGMPDFFGGMSGVVYALFGYVWMKGLYEPEQGMILHPNSVTLMLLWLALCMTGALGPIANAAHVVGLAVGIVFGVSRF